MFTLVGSALAVTIGGIFPTLGNLALAVIESLNGNTAPAQSIIGTTNQVVVTSSGGVITLTTPQSTATTSDLVFNSLQTGGF